MFEAVGSGLKQQARIPSSGAGFKTAGSCSKQRGRAGNGGFVFQAVHSGWKRRARVQSSGVGFETAGSHSKQWGRA